MRAATHYTDQGAYSHDHNDDQGVYCGLDTEVFLNFLPNYIHFCANIMQKLLSLDKREVLPKVYSQPQYFSLLTSGGQL